MLKCGGYVIFSVPFTNGQHKEHYPNLYDYKIELNNNEYILYCQEDYILYDFVQKKYIENI